MTPAIKSVETEIEYPAEDGEPMAESPVHVEAILLLHQAFQDFFRDRPDVFIASDIFWYWQEGDLEARMAPDVMVVPGVAPKERRDRRSYFSWSEGVTPAAVFEIASKGTWRTDRKEKLRKYEQLQVPEYFIFDPEARYMNPALIGFRLRSGVYTPIDEVDADTLSSELGFRLRPEGEMLRLIDERTGQPILTRAERVEAEETRAIAAESVLAAEKARADALAAEVERLKKLLNPSGSGATP